MGAPRYYIKSTKTTVHRIFLRSPKGGQSFLMAESTDRAFIQRQCALWNDDGTIAKQIAADWVVATNGQTCLSRRNGARL